MTPELVTRRRESMPGLAWLLGWDGQPGSPALLDHGAGVETRQDRFFEGAWDGEFETGDFHRSSAMTGSGCLCVDGGLHLVPPFHPQERLYSHRSGTAGVQVSNSLALLLAAIGDRPDPAHAGYYFDFLRTLRTGRPYSGRRFPMLRFERGSKVQLHEIDHLRIGPDLAMQTMPRPDAEFESSYASYRAFLKSKMEALARNAGHAARIRHYSPLMPVSQGFDSVAVASLAASLGFREAYTFVELEDAGPVARQLGLDCKAIDARKLDSIDVATARKFFAMPFGANRLMALAEDQLSGSLVFMGHGGDDVWESSTMIRGRRMKRPFDQVLIGNSYSEHRLQRGYFACPVPLLGAECNRRIQQITNSSEMRPWRRATEYDRPIPRRIAEESGVHRNLFAQQKVKGEMRPPFQMSAELRADFESYCRAQSIRLRVQHPAWPTVQAARAHRAWNGYVKIRRRLAAALGWSCRFRLRDLADTNYGQPELYTFHWANHHEIPRYRHALESPYESPAQGGAFNYCCYWL